MLGKNEGQVIADISHDIEPYDIAHMAFVVESVYQNFPEGTIHFIGQSEENGYLIAWVNGHYFVVPNNGVISLISDRRPDLLIAIDSKDHMLKTAAEVAVGLSTGKQPESFGEPVLNYKEFTKRKSRATKKEIAGHVIRVDHFGNLISNIELTDFKILSKDRKFIVHFGRESVRIINEKMNEVEPGDVFAKFNELERLVVGIFQGNGAQLLGLDFDSPITITFVD